MPPFIGQGLNSGIRDAAALAWRLGAILRDGASENIIGSFNLERKAHVDEVMRKAIALGDPICQTDVEKSNAMVSLHHFIALNMQA
jgi:2-polyprenyl-6-methoxyphenol hydroxylase-like FAD-dependent oxidoreductase